MTPQDPIEASAPNLRVVELFAGVGGFRRALEQCGWRVVWSNQWEPTTKKQHASDCYVRHFGPEGHVCEDIAKVLDAVEAGRYVIPDHELLVGGFPCQDYSVARVLSQAAGIAGRKGVLWWEIHRLLRIKRPQLLFLENVDRLLKSPASQRGRDFAIMLASLSGLGYAVEWRVINAADYGFPQRRRRIYVLGYLSQDAPPWEDALLWILQEGTFARAFPVRMKNLSHQMGLVGSGMLRGDRSWSPGHATPHLILPSDLTEITREFGRDGTPTPFKDAGAMWANHVWTIDTRPSYAGPKQVLADVLLDESKVDPSYFIPRKELKVWRYLKGAKDAVRRHKASGATYHYTEGAIPFPDPLDRPSRTLVTGEGGRTPSRFKHVVETPSGRFRRLTPVELERLNGFPDGWTEGMSDGRRAFLMGNALVVGVVQKIGQALLDTYLEGERRDRRMVTLPPHEERQVLVR